MGELIYLPAIGPTDLSISGFSRRMMEDWGITHNFLNKEKSIYYYPYFLISAHYGKDLFNMRKQFGLNNCKIIMGDSGGFQNVTLDANLDPLEVLRWQENNCTHGLILDQPPFENQKGSAMFGRASDKTFRDSLRITKNNAIVALTKRNKMSPFKLYGVIQGDDEKRKHLWFDEMKKLEREYGEFDGWALSPKPSYDIQQIAHHAVLILIEKINKPIHILQITGYETLAMAAYISTLHDNIVTVDSSSFAAGRRYMSYTDPMTITQKMLLGRDNNTIKLTDWPCMCPVCSKIPYSAFEREYEQGEKTVPGMILSLHNLYQTIAYTKWLNVIKNDKAYFRKFAKREFGQRFIDTLNYIDEALVVGHDKSWRKNIIKNSSLNKFFGEQKVSTPSTDDGLSDVVVKRLADLREDYLDVNDDILYKLYRHKYGSDPIGKQTL